MVLKRQAAQCIHTKQRISFKTHGYSRFHVRISRSCDILCASLSFGSLGLFILTLVVVHQFTTVWHTHTDFDMYCTLSIGLTVVCVACIERAYASPMKINNFVQFEINVQYSVEHWLPVRKDVQGLCARRSQNISN